MLIDKKLFKKYFQKDHKHSFVNLDLNIFTELREMEEQGLLKSSGHRAFAFGYTWLIHYLWKYSKYGMQEINTQDIKTILGISPIEKRVNYIIKKGGLLDSVGYTEHTRDFPIYSEFTRFEGLKITQLSDLDSMLAENFLKQYNTRYACKKPLMGYERKGRRELGLFFSKHDALPLSLFEFSRCVLCRDIGLNGFFTYAFLKYKIKLNGYRATRIYYSEFKKELGFSEKKTRGILNTLKEAGMISVEKVVTANKSKATFCQNNMYSLVHRGKHD